MNLITIAVAARLAFAHYYTLDAPKNTCAGVSGYESKVFWVASPECSNAFIREMDLDTLRSLGFVEAQCFKRHANSLPLRLEL